MGNTIQNIVRNSKKEAKVALLGLDGAGKTSILYRLSLNKLIPTVPTLGYNVETLEIGKKFLTLLDLAGQIKKRSIWKYYYNDCDAIIFVVDCSDSKRLIEAKEVLENLLSQPSLQDKKVLVYANKCDLQGGQSLENELKTIPLKQEWKIVSCSAVTGTGLHEGLNWLSQRI